MVDQNITFNATETFDAEGDNLTYYWEFGDDTNDTGMVVVHSYSSPGSYWVTLTVSDGELNTMEQIEIHVVVKHSGGPG
jgi:PKD repeat protein